MTARSQGTHPTLRKLAPGEKHLIIEFEHVSQGHWLRVWSEGNSDGGWSLHVRAGCDQCEAIAADAVHQVFPNVAIAFVDD